MISKMKQKLGQKLLINPSFVRSNFFSKCSKKLSVGHMIMFKVCKRCLQPCSLRQKKIMVVRDKYFKIYSKKLTPLTPIRYAMQMLTLLVIFEYVVFHEEISCETRTLYSMNQAHLIIISSNCIYFFKQPVWPIVSCCKIQK